MGYSISILNNIRANASTDYQNHIPEATRENIIAIGNALQSYTPVYNEFCEALINKIGKTYIESSLFKNKLARFKQGTIYSQQDVEDIFVEMAKEAKVYDPNGSNPLGRREATPVKVVYHRQNRQSVYEISIGDIDFVRVFRNEGTLDQFIKTQIQSVLDRAEYDEWLLMKNLLATYDGYFDYQVEEITDANAEKGAKKFVKTLRKAINDLTIAPSTKYNKAGVTTFARKEKLVAFVHKDVLAEVDVEVLAKAFNMGKTDIETTIVALDDFGTLENTYCLLVDEDFFKVFDTLNRMESQRNAQGLFTNYFLHIHQILSLSPFKCAVRFTTDTVE